MPVRVSAAQPAYRAVFDRFTATFEGMVAGLACGQWTPSGAGVKDSGRTSVYPCEVYPL
jgi:hypothetical protein